MSDDLATTPVPGFHAVVPAGGAGTRLWPLSRAGHPKFLLDLVFLAALVGGGVGFLRASILFLAVRTRP